MAQRKLSTKKILANGRFEVKAVLIGLVTNVRCWHIAAAKESLPGLPEWALTE